MSHGGHWKSRIWLIAHTQAKSNFATFSGITRLCWHHQESNPVQLRCRQEYFRLLVVILGYCRTYHSFPQSDILGTLNYQLVHNKTPHVVTTLWLDSDDVVTILSPTSVTSVRLENHVSVPPWFLHSDCVSGAYCLPMKWLCSCLLGA